MKQKTTDAQVVTASVRTPMDTLGRRCQMCKPLWRQDKTSAAIRVLEQTTEKLKIKFQSEKKCSAKVWKHRGYNANRGLLTWEKTKHREESRLTQSYRSWCDPPGSKDVWNSDGLTFKDCLHFKGEGKGSERKKSRFFKENKNREGRVKNSRARLLSS